MFAGQVLQELFLNSDSEDDTDSAVAESADGCRVRQCDSHDWTTA